MKITGRDQCELLVKWDLFVCNVADDIRHSRSKDVINDVYYDPFCYAEPSNIQDIVYSFYDMMRHELKINKAFSIIKKKLKTIGIEGCDFSGKTSMVNKLEVLGYETIKQPSTESRDTINKLTDVMHLEGVSKDNSRLLKFLIAFTFEIDRMIILFKSYQEHKGNYVLVSDRTSLSNFLVNDEMFSLAHMNLDDRVAYFLRFKRFDTIGLMYKKLLKLNLEIASYFNYTICWCSNFYKYSFDDVYSRVLEAKKNTREEACPYLDMMDTEDAYITRVIQQQNVVDVMLEKSKYINVFDIRNMYSSYFMDGDECLLKVISKIKEFL